MDIREANRNPHYVLATLYGEHTSEYVDDGLLQRNRRIWNGYFCADIKDSDKERLAKEANIDVDELRPLSNAELTELKKAFDKRLPGVKLPLPSEAIVLSGGTDRYKLDFIMPVHAHLVMRGYIFRSGCSIYARICKSAHFGNAVFLGPMTFLSTEFLGNLNLSRACFYTAAGLVGCVCDGNAYLEGAKFDGPFQLVNTAFRKYVDFSGASFDVNSKFEKVLFQHKAIFSRCRVSGLFSLSDVKFEGGVDFSCAHFCDDVSLPIEHLAHANFARSIFEGSVSFDDADFPKGADFSRAEFKGPASFANCVFGGASDFRDSRFDRPANFRTTIFSAHVPRLDGAMIHADTVFSTDAKRWPNDEDVSADAGRQTFGKIRHTTSKQGLPEEEHWFFRREMRFAARSGSFWQRLPYMMYWKLSDFGNSVSRPIIVMGFTLLTFWATFYLIDLIFHATQQTIVKSGSFWFSLSFANMFPFLGLHARFVQGPNDVNSTIFMVLSTLQMIISVLLLFLVGLGLRNKFRLK